MYNVHTEKKPRIIILQPVDGATDGATRRVICPASSSLSGEILFYFEIIFYGFYIGLSYNRTEKIIDVINSVQHPGVAFRLCVHLHRTLPIPLV